MAYSKVPRLSKIVGPSGFCSHPRQGALHQQIYDHFRTAITTGQLRPGDRLPSAGGRVDAYAMLAGEGYIVSRRAMGTAVSLFVAWRLRKSRVRKTTSRVRHVRYALALFETRQRCVDESLEVVGLLVGGPSLVR